MLPYKLKIANISIMNNNNTTTNNKLITLKCTHLTRTKNFSLVSSLAISKSKYGIWDK